jgi:predicted membrane metal-binding protein
MAVAALLMYLRVPAFRRHSERSGWRQSRDGRCISRGIQEVLRLLRVSVAAQAGTAPLALHYFGQFPVWFAITNLVAVPLASCIIFASVIFLILNPVPLAGLWAAQGLKLAGAATAWGDRVELYPSPGPPSKTSSCLRNRSCAFIWCWEVPVAGTKRGMSGTYTVFWPLVVCGS